MLTLQPKWLTIVRLPQKPKAFKCHHPETDGIPFRSCTASKRMAPRRRPQQRKSGWGRGWVHQKSGTTLSVKQPSQVKDHLYIYIYAICTAMCMCIENKETEPPAFRPPLPGSEHRRSSTQPGPGGLHISRHAATRSPSSAKTSGSKDPRSSGYLDDLIGGICKGHCRGT